MVAIDYQTISYVVGAFILPALAGTKYYLTLRSKKAAIQADVHAFRVLVDDVDNAVQNGTLPPQDAAEKIWSDILDLSKRVAETKTAPAPAPASTPAPTPSA